MKITKQGKLPSERIYEGRCIYCGTEFSAKASEGKRFDDQRDGSGVKFKCPFEGCGRDVYVNDGKGGGMWGK